MWAWRAPPKVATRSATPIAAPSWRAVFSTPEASPTSGPATAPMAPTLREGKPIPMPTPISARPGRIRRYVQASEAVEGRNETQSIPTAIAIRAGRAISPGARVSAARPTNGHTSSPQSGTGSRASPASIGS